MVEGARLESVCRGNSTVGSNPTLSASSSKIFSKLGDPLDRPSDQPHIIFAWVTLSQSGRVANLQHGYEHGARLAHTGASSKRRSEEPWCIPSEWLADAYTWEPGDATLYVLTDHVPRMRPIRGEVRRKWPVSARSGIVLTVDPMCTAREVAFQPDNRH